MSHVTSLQCMDSCVRQLLSQRITGWVSRQVLPIKLTCTICLDMSSTFLQHGTARDMQVGDQSTNCIDASCKDSLLQGGWWHGVPHQGPAFWLR